MEPFVSSRLTRQTVIGIKIVLIEKYSVGAVQTSLSTNTGEFRSKTIIEIPVEEVIEVPFACRSVSSDPMWRSLAKESCSEGWRGAAKALRGVRSEYRVEASSGSRRSAQPLRPKSNPDIKL